MSRCPTLKRLAATLGAALALFVILPAAAVAHAVVEETIPARGAELERAPKAVQFSFNEPVEAAFGAIRVFDADGDRVDTGELTRPGGSSEVIGTAIDRDTGDGTYTAVYRVVSADSHPVSGGFTFTVGEGGPAAAASVSELISEGDPSQATEAAFGVVRGLGYLAIALIVGLPVFAVLAFGPALAGAAGSDRRWLAAAEGFSARLRRWILIAAGLGFVTSLLAIILQTAIAAGVSVPGALDGALLREGLDTRFGTVMGLRALAFAAAAGLVLIPLGVAPRRPLEQARLGADGLAPVPVLSRQGLLLLGVPAAFLLISPALAGHPASQSPTELLVPASVLHVAAISVWLGGIAAFLLLVPTATRALDPSDRSRLLTEVLARFSPLALAAVAAIVASGIAQAIVHLGSLSELLDTGFGRAILAKSAILVVLVGFGALNRFLLMPRLRARAEASAAPGDAGRALRRSLIAELVLMVGALAATAFLSAAPPPAALAAGPQSGSLLIGDADVEWTVDPAAPGENEIHVYLFDAESGDQFEALKGFRVQLSLPDQDLGPIETEAELTGPGHYTVPSAPFGVAGDWQVDLDGRVGRFDAFAGSFEVEIR